MKDLGDFRKDWNAKKYLQQYYSGKKPTSDETISLKYLVDFLKTSDKIFERAIDVGSGPTLHQIIPLIPYVKELHLSDFLPENLKEIRKWLNDENDAHNWDLYIKFVLDLEGSRESIQKRKEDMRKRITRLSPVDIYQRYPLGVLKTYSLVTSFFCADSVTKDKEDWRKCMSNIFTLVETGGTVILVALRNAVSYRVIDRYFPSPHVNENDFKSILENCGFVNTDIQVISIPEWAGDGFDSAILAKAEKSHS
jgi:hypothetical protein